MSNKGFGRFNPSLDYNLSHLTRAKLIPAELEIESRSTLFIIWDRIKMQKQQSHRNQTTFVFPSWGYLRNLPTLPNQLYSTHEVGHSNLSSHQSRSGPAPIQRIHPVRAPDSRGTVLYNYRFYPLGTPKNSIGSSYPIIFAEQVDLRT